MILQKATLDMVSLKRRGIFFGDSVDTVDAVVTVDNVLLKRRRISSGRG